MAEGKRLLILTRHRASAPFRQRIEPYLAPLATRGIACEVVEFAKSAWLRRRQIRRAREFDGVLVHRKTLTAWDARALRGVRRIIYDFDDAVMYRARSPQHPHAGRVRRFARTVKAADLVIAGNPILAEHARSFASCRVAVIPTGLDASRYPPKSDYETLRPLRLVWIGSRSTLKHLKAFRPALEAIGRAMPALGLRIIADARLTLRGLTVENLPWNAETEATLLAESDIGLSPLPDTPYTRGKCGFKVLQYMAAGLPAVTSPVGVNADYVQDGQTGLWAKSPEDWVKAVQHLATNAALRERMGRAGRQRVCAEFDFPILAPRVCDLIEEALR